MKKQDIFIGFEVGTGETVNTFLSHLIVTGLTQLSGKTTTLEALIKRSGLKAIVFKTKKGDFCYCNLTYCEYVSSGFWENIYSCKEINARFGNRK